TMDNFSPRHGGSVFAVLVGASQVLGLVSVVLTGVWMGHYRGGFAWDGSAQEFNLHPLCMVLGLIFLHGDGKFTLILHHCQVKINKKLTDLFLFKSTQDHISKYISLNNKYPLMIALEEYSLHITMDSN
ncbi:hypothetical protein ILYODFUR_034729, partial [Ilyodon furcidens]